jgi:carbon starvation protein
VTLVPLAFLAAATLTAGWQKVFSPQPALGFLAQARVLAEGTNPNADRLIFNNYLDAGLALFFMIIVTVVIVASAKEWIDVWKGKQAVSNEEPFHESKLNATA